MTIQRGRDGVLEPPYTGALGSTRRETALIPAPDGSTRRVEIMRAVNTTTDPASARLALEGTLRRYGDVDLAVPFVYHDPAARRFALVIPLARVHEELQLRADLLLKLSADTAELLPNYVREARAVVGAAGLRKLLEESSSRASVMPPSQESVQREERLTRRTQEMSHREGAINARAEELDAVQNDLTMREQELDQRLSELMSREESLSQEERAMRANIAALNSREKRLQAFEEDVTRREAALNSPSQSGEQSLADLRQETEPEPLTEEALELEPEEQTGRLSTVGPAPVLATPELEPEADELMPEEVAVLEELPRDPEATALWVAHGGRSWAAVVEGEVRLWTQGSPETAHEVTAGSATPVLQCDPDGLLPVALLSVRTESGHTLTRVGIDYGRPEDRSVIEALTRDFRVRVEVMSPSGRAIGSQVIGAPCEGNAQRVMELLSQRAPASADERQMALGLLVTDGLRWEGTNAALPESAYEQEFETSDTVAALLARYEPLLDGDRLTRLAVSSGRSPAQIDALGKRLMLAALRCGVLLSPRLVERAVRVGIAADERALAQRALTAFARTVEGGLGAIGRTPIEASRAWRVLTEWAERAGATLNEPIRAAIAAVYNPDEPGSFAPPDARVAPSEAEMAAMSDAELVALIDHKNARLSATRLLVARDLSAHAAQIARAMRWLPADDAAAVATEIMAHGDSAGDLWVELLASPRRVVAALAGVGCAAIKLRRAINPLVQRALGRDDDDWRLFGWAAGEFGPALVRAVARLDGAPADRLAWMLGHAVRAGASKELERSRSGMQGAVLEASTRALAIQDDVRTYDASLRRGALEGELERACGALLARHAGASTEPAEGFSRTL